jgi:hypothetical protein
MSEIIQRGGWASERTLDEVLLPKLPSGPGPGSNVTAQKVTAYVQISRELLEMWNGVSADAFRDAFDPSKPPLPPPPDPGPNPAYARLLEAAQSNPVLAELVELHKAVPAMVRQDGSVTWWECRGEPPSGYEWDHAEWPCETSAVIAQHLGVDLALPVKAEDA